MNACATASFTLSNADAKKAVEEIEIYGNALRAIPGAKVSVTAVKVLKDTVKAKIVIGWGDGKKEDLGMRSYEHDEIIKTIAQLNAQDPDELLAAMQAEAAVNIPCGECTRLDYSPYNNPEKLSKCGLNKRSMRTFEPKDWCPLKERPKLLQVVRKEIMEFNGVAL